MKMDSMDWTVWIESWKLNKKVTIFENVSDRISKIRILALNQENFKFLFFINELPLCNSHFDHSRSHQTHLTCWLSFEKLVDVIVFNTLAQCSAIWDLGAPSLLLKVHQVGDPSAKFIRQLKKLIAYLILALLVGQFQRTCV